MQLFSFLRRRRSANLQIPRLTSAPAGQRLYVVGDVHGRADLLIETQARIDADIAKRPCIEPIEIYLGDVIDRGPGSAEVVLALMKRLVTHNVIVLSGNHERMLVEAIHDDEVLTSWLQHGGLETLRSYGADDTQSRLSDMATHEMRALIASIIPDAHISFLEALPFSFASGDYFFAHAGIRPGVPLHAQNRRDLIWIREPFLSSSADHGLVVVHGHTPVLEPEFRGNRINIDTGAYLTGRLTCLILEGDLKMFLTAENNL
ncbi:metallophosphoesterase [Methylorubrum extorquens]